MTSSFFLTMTKSVEVFTVQISRWRLVRELGIHLLDITAKSGNPAFAPHYEDVMHYKHHEMNWEDYEALYRQRMRQSRRDSPDEWEKLKDLPPKVALACYCKPGDKCHRHIFKELLSDYLKDNQIDVTYKGELTNYTAPQVTNPPENVEHVPHC